MAEQCCKLTIHGTLLYTYHTFLLQFSGDNKVKELDVDNGSVPSLCRLGLHEACPRVEKLTLSCNKTVTTETIKAACSPFLQLTELHVKRHSFVRGVPSLTPEVSFCDAVVSFCEAMVSCTSLTKLSISHFELGNHVAAEILRGMRVHDSLKHITYVQTSHVYWVYMHIIFAIVIYWYRYTQRKSAAQYHLPTKVEYLFVADKLKDISQLR